MTHPLAAMRSVIREPSAHLRFLNISKTYSTQAVLRNVNLSIEAGQFVCVLGASGCGKSTLLRLLAGLESPDFQSSRQEVPSAVNSASESGKVEASGIELVGGDGAVPQMGFVFQHPNLLPWRTVAQNISLPLQLQRLSRARRHEAVTLALSQVGLTSKDGLKWPRMLSGGMQMRASLARAIVTQPQVMLLDEPFSALDEVLRQRLCEELRQWHRQLGWTTVFVTHHVSEAVFLADRIIVFRNLASAISDDTASLARSGADSVALDISLDFPDRDGELRERREYVEAVVSVTKRFREVLG